MQIKILLNSQLATRNSQPRSGFTLLELTVVLFLVALVLGLSSLFFARSLPSARLNSVSRELSATIRQARSYAQSEGAAQTVLLNLDAQSYGIEGRGTRSLPRGVGIRVIDPLLGPVQQGVYRVLFDATGGIDTATIELWNATKLVRIETDPIVGTVTIKQ